MIELDVLIVGGGAQGLWLLNDLTKRDYRAILVQRGDLGAGQTCHSHGLIHRGHYYDDIDMMIVLNAAAQFWEAFVKDKGAKRLNPGKALAGFGPGIQVDRHRYFWNSAGLRYEHRAEIPDVLDGGLVRHLFDTEEFSVDASEVVACLARDIDHAIYGLDDGDDALRFQVKGTNVVRVHALIDGQEYELAPRYVILAAGIGNRALLRKLGADMNTDLPNVPVQAQRKSHMMVVRGADLPVMTAVFPIKGGLEGVFLCPRSDQGTGRTVWLASDHHSLPFEMSFDGSPSVRMAPHEKWIRRMLVSFEATAPALFTDQSREDLELCVYTGLTSERNFGGGNHMTDAFLDQFGFDNLMAIWPTKLTLTPFASNIAVRFVRTKVPRPGGNWPRVFERDIEAGCPPVSPEMWCQAEHETAKGAKTSWLPYDEFVDRWAVRRTSRAETGSTAGKVRRVTGRPEATEDVASRRRAAARVRDAGFAKRTSLVKRGSLPHPASSGLDDQELDAVHAAVSDEDHDVRLTATIAAGDVGDVRSVRVLEHRLAGDDEDVRLAAIDALSDIGGLESLRILTRIASARDEARDIRIAALTELEELATKSITSGPDRWFDPVDRPGTGTDPAEPEEFHTARANLLDALATIQADDQVHPLLRLKASSIQAYLESGVS